MTGKNQHSDVTNLPLIPLRDAVLFPRTIMPFLIGREQTLKALNMAIRTDRRVFLATQRSAATLNPRIEDIFSVGTVGNVIESLRCDDGSMKVLIEGLDRGRILDSNYEEFHLAAIKLIRRRVDLTPDLQRMMEELHTLLNQYSQLYPNVYWESLLPQRMEDPGQLADSVAISLSLPLEEKQNLLEMVNPAERLVRVLDLLKSQIDEQKMDKRIGKQVRRQMEKAQREYYLSEKMKAIQKELGQSDETVLDESVQAYRKKMDALLLPEDAREKANQELRKLQMMPSLSAESTVTRNYLDWLLGVPWSEQSQENEDLKAAEKILQDDHFGLDKIKERILEFLASRKLSNRKGGATILCFVGPPGVGKTSLANSIARAMGRKFVRLSLGGVRDEAEIRGHRRTYVGAFPGQIVQLMKRAGTTNPIFLFDEVDKMGADFRGDPAAALLEVLDPEQNKAFLDHYLDTPYDLSRVFFIATANVPYNIPPALYDRMEVLQLPGYTEEEKTQIASRFLVPKELELHGLTDYKVQFKESAIQYIIRFYTREAGVRNLQREIASICRKIAKKVALTEPYPRVIDVSVTKELLGIEKFTKQDLETKDEIGMATGLAWTEMGGELLFTEASLMKGKGRLTLTGKMGKVMQESARAALSYIRSRIVELGVPVDFHQNFDFHVHIPEGAIPKDGPSAGITMATALVSALTRNPVKRDVAMTGEITLRGRVLPIGGVKEKILAAHRAGVATIIMPRKNEKDLEEIPIGIRKQVQVKLVDSMDEVLPIALIRPVRKRRKKVRPVTSRKSLKKELTPQ